MYRLLVMVQVTTIVVYLIRGKFPSALATMRDKMIERRNANGMAEDFCWKVVGSNPGDSKGFFINNVLMLDFVRH